VASWRITSTCSVWRVGFFPSFVQSTCGCAVALTAAQRGLVLVSFHLRFLLTALVFRAFIKARLGLTCSDYDMELREGRRDSSYEADGKPPGKCKEMKKKREEEAKMTGASSDRHNGLE